VDAKALEALKGSIKKWERIVEGTGVDEGADNCPLCELFWHKVVRAVPFLRKSINLDVLVLLIGTGYFIMKLNIKKKNCIGKSIASPAKSLLRKSWIFSKACCQRRKYEI